MTPDKVALTTEELGSAIALCRPNRPILATTRERDGTPHVAPFAWCMPSSANPPIVTLALLSTPRKQHTLVNVERTGEFVVNLPNNDIAAELVRSSYRYPTGVKKVGFLELDFEPAQRVDAPVIRQCRAHIECRLQSTVVTGDHTLLVGEVVAASYAAEQYEPGFIQAMADCPACIHLGHRPYPGGQTHAFVVGNATEFLSIPFNLPTEGPESVGPDSRQPNVRHTDTGPAVDHPVARLKPVTGPPTLFATGFACPDGPTGAGERLIVVDWAAGVVRQVQPDGEVSDLADTGGMPTGACSGPDGQVYVCDMGRRELLSIAPDGVLDVIVGERPSDKPVPLPGKPLLGPRDCVLDEHGNLYFTDADGFHPLAPSGCLYVRRPDSSVELLADGFAYPGGLALARPRAARPRASSGRYLYVAETFAQRIHRLELDAAGRVRQQVVFAELEGGLGPDGLTVDEAGHVYVAHFGKGVVAVLDPAGRIVAELPTGGFLPTNVTFWQDALYVTELERGCVLRFEVDPRAVASPAVEMLEVVE